MLNVLNLPKSGSISFPYGLLKPSTKVGGFFVFIGVNNADHNQNLTQTCGMAQKIRKTLIFKTLFLFSYQNSNFDITSYFTHNENRNS